MTDRQVIFQAYVNFRKVTRSPRNENTLRVFNQFINVPEGVLPWGFGYVEYLSPETIEKIEWLTGPNYEFMFKVWKAKYGTQGINKPSTGSVEAVGKGDREG